jgi:hypothetical protein
MENVHIQIFMMRDSIKLLYKYLKFELIQGGKLWKRSL